MWVRLMGFCGTKDRFIIVIALLMAVASSALGQDAGQPGEFLRYGVGGRALGMGRAFTAVADDASAIYWNPGGLAGLYQKGFNLMFMSADLYGGTKYSYWAAGIPLTEFHIRSPVFRNLSYWSLGIGYVRLSTGGFEARNEKNIPGAEFSDVQDALILCVTRRIEFLGQEMGLGGNIKYIRHKLFGKESSVFGVDFGFKLIPSIGWMNLGFALKNINRPNIGFEDGGHDIIPRTGRIGIIISPKTRLQYINSLLVSLDYQILPPRGRRSNFYFGLEYDLNIIYNLPLKLRFGFDDANKSFAFGVNLDLPNQPYYPRYNEFLPAIDWSFVLNNDKALGASQLFSLDFSWTRWTARYWYEKGMQKFPASGSDTKMKKCSKIEKISPPKMNKQAIGVARECFQSATKARNPGNDGYICSALLRLGDLEVITATDKIEGLRQALPLYEKACSIKYEGSEIDRDLNQLSYYYYIQSLIVAGKYKEALKLCDTPVIWCKHKTNKDADKKVRYLKLYAQWKQTGEIDSSEAANLHKLGPVNYILALMYYKQKNYKQALNKLEQIIEKNLTVIPYIYVPYFKDNYMLDDAHMEISEIYIAQRQKGKAVRELGQVLRFFINSDNAFKALNRLSNILKSKP